MDFGFSTLLYMFIALLLVIPNLSLPVDTDEDLHIDEKRPKYMDTRRNLDAFKQLVWESLLSFVKEGKINPEIVSEDITENDDTMKTDKRRAHLGFCLRRSGRNFIPYPCYRQVIEVIKQFKEEDIHPDLYPEEDIHISEDNSTIDKWTPILSRRGTKSGNHVTSHTFCTDSTNISIFMNI